MEDFITYELAVKLKEKGFKEKCIRHYYPNSKDWFLTSAPDCENFSSYVDAPTISQVLKWLREEKDIDIVIAPIFTYNEILGKMREYNCKIFAPKLNKPEHCGYHETYEQAALAGIEYVLDNLI